MGNTCKSMADSFQCMTKPTTIKLKKKKKEFSGTHSQEWRWEWQPTPVLLPGESHGQRSLAGTAHGGHRESDMTEPRSTHTGTARKLTPNTLRVGGWGNQRRPVPRQKKPLKRVERGRPGALSSNGGEDWIDRGPCLLARRADTHRNNVESGGQCPAGTAAACWGRWKASPRRAFPHRPQVGASHRLGGRSPGPATAQEEGRAAEFPSPSLNFQQFLSV